MSIKMSPMHQLARRCLRIVALAFLLPGCSHTYQPTVTNPDVLSRKLVQNVTAYVAVPENGRYGDILYSGSGESTAQVLVAEFSKHLSRVSKGVVPETYQEALVAAHAGAFRYLIYPTILHWEDRATEWSGRPDRILLKIVVADTGSDNVISSVLIEGKSRWFTFGGDHPQDLLPDPIQGYVASLFL
jgi:uncharacterized protein DUF4823